MKLFQLLLLLLCFSCGANNSDNSSPPTDLTDSAESNDSDTQDDESSTFTGLKGVIDETYGIGGKKMDMFIGESYVIDIIEKSDESLVLGGVAKLFTVNDYISAMFYDQDGDLFVTNDSTGKLKTGLAGNGIQFKGSFLASDESIIFASDDASKQLTKITSANIIDTSFGTGGVLNLELDTGKSHELQALEASSNDQFYALYLVEGTSSGVDNLGVAKLDSDGNFVMNFNTTGKKIIELNEALYSAYMARSSDDSVFLAKISSGTITIYKINNDGALDTSFDADGGVDYTIADADYTNLYGLATQGEKLLVFGEVEFDGEYSIYVTRFNDDGTVDTTFADNGTLFYNYPDEYQFPTTIEVISENRIVFGGGLEQDSGDDSEFFIVMLSEDGEIDTDFADNGLFTCDFLGDWDELFAIKELSSGKLLLGGYAHDGEKSSFGTVRVK